MANWPSKRVNEILDFSIDWSQILSDDTDTISTVLWTVPGGVTKTAEQISGGRTTAWISGGTAATSYSITCKIVTTGGRTHERVNTLGVT